MIICQFERDLIAISVSFFLHILLYQRILRCLKYRTLGYKQEPQINTIAVAFCAARRRPFNKQLTNDNRWPRGKEHVEHADRPALKNRLPRPCREQSKPE